ncbi:MAG: chitobiase/beta-hexosaminidase C-terminal domain-containing protein, partial [Candidatus Hydrogenedentota bacterium]
MIYGIRHSNLVRALFLLGFVAFVARVEAQTDVWVDLSYPGTETGSQALPFDTVQKGLDTVGSGGTLHLGPGDSHETLLIDQPVRLEASGGTARLGVVSSPLGSGAPLRGLRFTEIMYNPGDGWAEFIEIQNTGANTLDVSGVYFSQGINYTFPGGSMLVSGELITLVRDTDQEAFMTNFGETGDGTYTGKLSNSGETVALSNSVNVEFLSVTYDDSGSWPGLADGQGYSLILLDTMTNGSNASDWGLSENVGGSPYGIADDPTTPVADTEFSVERGFYTSSFMLALSSETFGATIRYTLDGSTPTCSTGIVYSGPISITGTSTVRAIACKSEFLSTNVDTQTYIFLADILTQGHPGGGWPSENIIEGQQVWDYAMDSAVTTAPAYAADMDDALLSIPSISIVTELSNLVDLSTGIYMNATNQGIAWERPASVELLNPDGSIVSPNLSKGFQEDAGLRIRGGYSRNWWFPKHGFRLFFRDEYGAGKLEYPLYGDEGVDEFDKVDLRTTQQYSWTQFPEVAHLGVYNRDVFSRDTQRDMDQPYTRSRYYHLYLNGVYWGLFQSQERAEARYAASYFGGDKEDYDVIKVNSGSGNPYTMEATDGNLDAWNGLWAEANAGVGDDASYNRIQGLDPDGSPNPAYPILLDAENLIDYILIIYFGGNLDSPISWFIGDENVENNGRPNNIYTTYNRNAPDGFKSFIHDAEHTLLNGFHPWSGMNELFRDRTGPFPYGGDVMEESNPQWLHQQLVSHPEYRMLFADRTHRHFFNGGALTPEANSVRFTARADEIEYAIIGESARWGDFIDRYEPATWPKRTKNDSWIPAIDDVLTSYFPQRTDIVLGQLWSQGWYPDVDAPVFNMNGGYQHGGYASSPYSMSMTNPNVSGDVYYTLDGSDPRQAGTVTTGAAATIVSDSAAHKVIIPTSIDDVVTDGALDVTYYKSIFAIPDLTTAWEDVINNVGNQASTSYEAASVINYVNTGPSGHYGSDNAFPGIDMVSDVDDFAILITGSVYIPQGGDWTFGV